MVDHEISRGTVWGGGQLKSCTFGLCKDIVVHIRLFVLRWFLVPRSMVLNSSLMYVSYSEIAGRYYGGSINQILHLEGLETASWRTGTMNIEDKGDMGIGIRMVILRCRLAW